MKIEADRILATSNISGEARDKLRVLLEEIVAGLGAVAGKDNAIVMSADEALREPGIRPPGAR